MADRTYVLVSRARSAGLLPSYYDDPADEVWRSTVARAIHEMDERANEETNRLIFAYHAAVLGWARADEPSHGRAAKGLKSAIDLALQAACPWRPIRDVAQEMRERYRQLIGDPDDPDVRRKLDAEASKMMAQLTHDLVSAAATAAREDRRPSGR